MKKIILVALAAFLAFTAVSVARNFDDGVAKKNLNGIPHAVNAKGALKAHSVGHLQLKNAIIDCQKLVISLRARVCGNRLSVPNVSGPAGIAGAVGETGAQGPKGDAGPAGADGAQGTTGETGATGERGPKGYKGEKGEPGKDGSLEGTSTIEVCVSNGGTLQMNVHGHPCDNEGHTPITLLVIPTP